MIRPHPGELVEDDDHEVLFDDPRRPDRAVLLDTLPGNLRVGSDGQVQDSARDLLAIALPAIGLLPGIAVWLLMAG